LVYYLFEVFLKWPIKFKFLFEWHYSTDYKKTGGFVAIVNDAFLPILGRYMGLHYYNTRKLIKTYQ